MTMTVNSEVGMAQVGVSAAVVRTGELMPRSFESLMKLATMAATSGLAKVSSPEQAATIIMTGLELGLTPMQALRGIYVVEGRPFLSADMMVALVRQSGQCVEWDVVEKTDTRCTIRAQRVGGKPIERGFTREDAQRANLKSVHASYPATMLYHRCCATICRELWPDILLGMYASEEQGDEVSFQPSSRVVASRPEPVVVDVAVTTEAPAAPVPAPSASRDWSAEIAATESVEALGRLGDELRAAANSKAIDLATSRALGAEFKARKAALAGGAA